MELHWNPENKFKCSMKSVGTFCAANESGKEESECRDLQQSKIGDLCSMISR